MNISIDHGPAHSLAVVQLQANEQIRAESGAMVSMSNNIAVRTDGPMSKKGGLFKRLKRVVLSGETFFTNEFIASNGPGEVTLAPSLCGDMIVHNLNAGEDLFIQGSSYVAAPDSVDIDTKWQGFKKGLLSGESMFFLHATGQGPVVVNAFGAIHAIDLDGELIVDTGHIVAFSNGIDYEISKAAKGWISSFLSGEGFVLRMRGRGRVYVQTRNPKEYGTQIGRKLPPKEK